MSSTSTRTTRAAIAVAVLALGSALGGCSISRDDDSARSRSSASAEPSATPSEDVTDSTAKATPSASPTPSPTETVSVTPSAEPTTSETAEPTSALLDAAQMPRLNRASPWSQGRTGVARARPFGLCQKFDLLSIGALSAHERGYAFQGDTAGHLVAEFPDVQNAARAMKVLEAWRRDCADRVRGTSVNVRPLTDVAVTNGTAWTYLVSYERAGEGRFHSLGVVRAGARLSLVRIDHVGQDHNYAPGKEPTGLAVKAASAKLG